MRGRGRPIAGNRTPGPRGSYLGGYSAGRGIYSRYHDGKTKQPEKTHELMPSLELAASVNPVGIKPGTSQWARSSKLSPSSNASVQVRLFLWSSFPVGQKPFNGGCCWMVMYTLTFYVFHGKKIIFVMTRKYWLSSFSHLSSIHLILVVPHVQMTMALY